MRAVARLRYFSSGGGVGSHLNRYDERFLVSDINLNGICCISYIRTIPLLKSHQTHVLYDEFAVALRRLAVSNFYCELIELSDLPAAFLALAIEPKPFFICHLFDLLQAFNSPSIVLGINFASQPMTPQLFGSN